MISISPIEDMPADLVKLVTAKARRGYQRATYYGIMSTTAPEFKATDLGHALVIVSRLFRNDHWDVFIEPGEWQSGAMRYVVYLID